MKSKIILISLVILMSIITYGVSTNIKRNKLKSSEYLPLTSNSVIKSNDELVKESSINMHFVDESTGILVIPELIEINHRSNRELHFTVKKSDIASDGGVSIDVPNGIYDIIVTSASYESMSTYFELNNKSINVNFNLVPLIRKNELSPNYIKSLLSKQGMVVVGYITDHITNQALANVDVYTKDKKANSKSNKDGFFQIIIPLPESDKLAADRGQLYFSKGNYTTEIKRNFDMWPEGDVILQINMKEGSGENIKDIITTRTASIITLE